MFLLRKGFLSLEKLILVPILQFGANAKFYSDNKDKCCLQIVGYSIYALINPFTARQPIYQSKLRFRYMIHFV